MAVHYRFLLLRLFEVECDFVMIKNNQSKSILLRCSVAIAITILLLCIHYSLEKRAWYKCVTHITNGAGIPVSGKVLGTGPGIRLELFDMSPDRDLYLVFQSSEPDIREFAKQFSEGTSIEDWSRSPTRFGPSLRNYSDECPNFDLTKIKNGRFWHVPGIVCAIDVDRNIVYLLD